MAPPGGDDPEPSLVAQISVCKASQMYGKQTETAIAALSRLAEVYDEGRTRLSAADIARSRDLQGPTVAKIMTVLSQAGLVSGSPGPGGGYTLAMRPDAIPLYNVFILFEREDNSNACPFGGGTCGVGPDCALHERLVHLKQTFDDLLHKTTFAIFYDAAVRAARAGQNGEDGIEPGPRQSYRASKR